MALEPGSAKAECPGKARGVLATSFAWVGPQGAIRHQPGQSWILGRKSQRAGSPGTSNATREPCARRVGKPPQRTQKVAVRRSVISAKSTRGYGFTTTRREGGRERRRRNDKTHTTRAARHGQPQRTPPARLHRRRRLTHTEKKTQLGTNCPKLAAMVHGHTHYSDKSAYLWLMGTSSNGTAVKPSQTVPKCSLFLPKD